MEISKPSVEGNLIPVLAFGNDKRTLRWIGNNFKEGAHELRDVPPSPEPKRPGEKRTMDPEKIENSRKSEMSADQAVRKIVFWRNGFTVEDGELMRYDDPNNEAILVEINAGRAPPSLFKVQPGDPVELRVLKRIDQDYVPSKRGCCLVM